MTTWAGVVPALLAALLAAWCGNLLGSVTAAGSATTLLALLLFQIAAPRPRPDPLRLGGLARLAPAALWLLVAASAWASPVPRAGLAVVILLPAWLCLPGALARCWSTPAARRLGARALALAVLALAAWSLAAALRGAAEAAAEAQAQSRVPPSAVAAAVAGGVQPGAVAAAVAGGVQPGAVAAAVAGGVKPGAVSAAGAGGAQQGAGGAQSGVAAGAAGRPLRGAAAAAREVPGLGATLAPLGHHTLLATWLAILLPFALLPLREATPWRWLGAAAGLAGVAALLVTRSLSGGAALGVEVLLVAAWYLRSAGAAADLGSAATAARPASGLAPGGQAAGIGTLGAGRAAGIGTLGAERAAGIGELGAERAAGMGELGAGRAAGEPGVGRAGRHWRNRRWLVVGGLALVVVAITLGQVARLRRIGTARDRSVAARVVYLRAGWEGFRERPWLGWGPGSVGWTAAWFLVPRPGLNPWGEAVGELHSLPIQLAYEIGAPGLAAALLLAGLFLRRRWQERAAAVDPLLLAAGCLGLAGGAVAWLGTAALAVPALPFAMALAAAAALAGSAPPTGRTAGSPGPAGGPRGAGVWVGGGGVSLAGCVYGLVAAAALLAPEVARWHYDRAVAAGEEGRREVAASELAAAVHLDPGFPLYELRLALIEADRQEDRGRAAGLAAAAARQTRGVGLPWLVAGILGRAAGEVWAPAALEQGCALDPLSPWPPFYLVLARPGSPLAPRLAARALLAEPRLAAATFWEGREGLFRQALEEVRRWPGVDPGWKLGLLAAAPRPEERRGGRSSLALAIDAAGFTQSTSLHLFRRVPWPALWPLIAVREELLPALDLPPATSLGSRDGAQLALNACIPH